MTWYHPHIKSVLDKIIAVLLLVLLFPLLVLISVIIIISYSRNPFFIQNRPGKDGKIFRLIKFRTMNEAKDGNGRFLSDDQRITPFGQWLRRISSDEIPQLVNVLKGEMSLIGPRPLLEEYLSLYNEEQLRRHDVLPGITGWAQVNGRNDIEWEKRFQLDLWYVDHVSFGLDFKILLLTLKKVVQREGISSDNFVTMEKFKGTVL